MGEICFGVLGHVDHGKTTIVKMLTNKNTDHLVEEQKRGLSINIAFSFYETKNRLIAFIDLPGHEKFIKNMIAGASNINAGLLTVALDDGIMPQTIEHLQILDIFNIKDLIVVYTKSDLVDSQQKQTVINDVEKMLLKSNFEIHQSCVVNNKDEKSYETIKKALDIFEIEEKNLEEKPYRLDIDRSFTLQGKGTIITGTSKTGIVNINDSLLIQPINQLVKVKEIQVNEKTVLTAYPGQRTALRISDVNYNDIERGFIIATPDSLQKSEVIDVYFKYSENNTTNFKNKTPIKIFIGTNNFTGKLNLIGQKIVTPGTNSFAQIIFNEVLYFNHHEIGIIKNLNSDEIIGGFEIVRDTKVKIKHRNTNYLSELTQIKFGSIQERTLIELKNNSKKIISWKELECDIENLNAFQISQIVFNEELVMHLDNFNIISDKIISCLNNYHTNNTLRNGMNYLEFSSSLKNLMNIKNLNFILNQMILNKTIKVDKQTYSLKHFEVKLSDEQHAIKNLILRRIKEWGLKPKEISTIKDKVNNKKIFNEMLKYLLGNKSLIQINEMYFITSQNYLKAINQVKLYFSTHSELTLNDAKILFDLNHKFLVMLLEKMDYDKITFLNKKNNRQIKK